ncbi:penicillin acylase family protein [Alloacidobacterium dinghuense]|uniref:Penicillin acylase family protein n=1 Tax=Alloacidobacterium dinghuense TaxID=2763107 RepID=A0A7G8BLB4_9BACT|nr:penicillin acylase family protein [Alloacidobacterium dinghuense]QNI33334.1 penicillin acylase family protein [Alloacidobacterium dinghuense]
MALGRTVQLKEEKRRHPILRFFVGFVFVIIVALLVGVLGGAWWLKHAMRDSLPQLDGQARLPGLSVAVNVRRDQHGIPHIEAATLDDLFEAQGYVTAQDRLWQMDMARRLAAGELAELLGKNLLEHDRMQRVLQMRATAERMTATLPERDRRYFEDYARGVNAFIDSHREHLPAEFRLLRYRPKAWQPVDSVLIGLNMVQILDQHWQDKLSRERIESRLGPTLSADLYPTGSWRDHPPTVAPPDLTAPQQSIPDVPLDESQTSLQDLLRLREVIGGSRDVCRECNPGSNEWAISGAHTATGKPILANDMHLSHNIPNTWYEVDLKSGGFHVAGVSIAGVPFVIAGHNNHIAWGYTALYGDTQDIYVEQTNAQNEYQSASGWHAFEHTKETIHVRGGSDVTVDVERSDHGVVLNPVLPNERRTLSLRWVAYDSKANRLPLFDLNSATDWESFRQAVTDWWAPTLNVIYDDDQGHIGYQAIGYIPNRPTGIKGTPIADTQHEWQGFIPFDQMPSTFDPANGILATANSRVTPDNYPYQITLEWASPYRNERIWKWLSGKDKLTPAEMITLQTDTYSELDEEFAQRFAYAIDHAKITDARLRQAADLMRSWDGVVGVDSAPAAIVAAAKHAFWPMLLEPKLGDDAKLYEWAASAFAQEEIVMHAPAQWLPKDYATWDDFLAACVSRGIDEGHAPADLRNWHYGDKYPVDLEHPLYGLIPYFKNWTGTGAQPQSGDLTTVKQVDRTFGPSQRFTMDWSNIDGSMENIVMGESGNPLSAYYRDQWTNWYHGTTFALPFSEAAVAASTSHTLRLLP